MLKLCRSIHSCCCWSRRWKRHRRQTVSLYTRLFLLSRRWKSPSTPDCVALYTVVTCYWSVVGNRLRRRTVSFYTRLFLLIRRWKSPSTPSCVALHTVVVGLSSDPVWSLCTGVEVHAVGDHQTWTWIECLEFYMLKYYLHDDLRTDIPWHSDGFWFSDDWLWYEHCWMLISERASVPPCISELSCWNFVA